MPELRRQDSASPVDADREAMTDRPLLSTSGGRLFLFVIRRMAAAGVNDAHASSALLGNFGISYRRPLILMRAMMLELARVSNRKILVGPCCYAGMTDDEARLTRIMAMGQQEPKTAYDELSVMLDSDAVLGALTCAQAVAQSYADLGCPIDLYAAE